MTFDELKQAAADAVEAPSAAAHLLPVLVDHIEGLTARVEALEGKKK